MLCNTCNSFPCRVQAKSDADVLCVRAAVGKSNVTLWTGAFVRRVLTDASGKRVDCGRDRAGRTGPSGQGGNRHRVLRGSELGGVAAAVSQQRASERVGQLVRSGGQALHGAPGDDDRGGRSGAQERHDVFRRRSPSTTTISPARGAAIRSGRSRRRDARTALMAKLHAPWWGRWIPLPIYNWWVGRGYDWLAMSEDLPREDNRVTLDGGGRIVLRYRPTNMRAHRQLVAEMKRILARLGLRFPVTHSLGTEQHDTPVRHPVLRHGSRARRCSTRTAARTTCPISSSWTRRSFLRRRPSTRGSRLPLRRCAWRTTSCQRKLSQPR